MKQLKLVNKVGFGFVLFCASIFCFGERLELPLERIGELTDNESYLHKQITELVILADYAESLTISIDDLKVIAEIPNLVSVKFNIKPVKTYKIEEKFNRFHMDF